MPGGGCSCAVLVSGGVAARGQATSCMGQARCASTTWPWQQKAVWWQDTKRVGGFIALVFCPQRGMFSKVGICCWGVSPAAGIPAGCFSSFPYPLHFVLSLQTLLMCAVPGCRAPPGWGDAVGARGHMQGGRHRLPLLTGVVPNDGQFPIAQGLRTSLLCTGPMCRYAEDLEPMLRVMAGSGVNK